MTSTTPPPTPPRRPATRPRAPRFTWLPAPMRPIAHALRLLLPGQQRHLLEFWRSTAYKVRGEPVTWGFDRRHDVYALERILKHHDASETGFGPLFPRLARWGLYRVLAREITDVTSDLRAVEAKRRAIAESERQRLQAEQAASKAADEAASARITELLGEHDTLATYIHYPSGHVTPGLDTVLYLPEPSDYEPDPDRPNTLVKSPALAVRVKSNEWNAQARAHMAGDGNYHGINLHHRLRAAHPEIFTDQAEPTP